MAAPTLVGVYRTAWNSATPSNISVPVQTGDLLVRAYCAEGNYAATHTNGGLTWTQQRVDATSGYCAVELSTTTATSTTTLTLGVSSTLMCGIAVWVFRGSDGLGNSNIGKGGQTISLTTTQADSAIAMLMGDWNATSGSRTYSTATAGTFTEADYYIGNGQHYAMYCGTYAGAGTAAAKTVGTSAPTSSALSIIAMEVKGTASGVTATGAITLGTTTASAAGAVALAATSATTTTAATVAAVAKVAVAATATPTLTAATVSATATVASATVEATASLTLVAATAASVATVAVAATSTRTLGAATATSAAAVAIAASSAVTTTAATAASAATAAAAATASATLTAATVSGSATSETPQYGRPISDTDATGWTASGGGALYAMVDESTYNDADYIYTETPDADAEVAITSLSDPGTSAGHVVRYRARALNGGQIKLSVYESTTLVQEWTDTPSDEFATIEHLVTNSVTDYSAIRLRFTALQGT
jgi:hypothetical protein